MTIQIDNPVSRRTLLPLIAASAFSPVLLIARARAQDAGWLTYRRADLGFEVEMPGKPKIETNMGERDDVLIREVDAQVDVEGVLYGANYQEFRGSISLNEKAAIQREAARSIGAPITRETPFMVDGVTGMEFAVESTDGLNSIMRIVIVENRRVLISIHGGPTIHTGATTRRFLDSVKLLPTAR